MATTPQTPSPETTEPVSPVAPTAEALAEPVSITKSEDGQYNVQLETGEKFTGSADEVIATISKAKLETGKWGRELKAEMEAIKEQMGPISQALTPKEPAPTPEQLQEQQLLDYWAEQNAKTLGFANAQEMRDMLGVIRQTTEQTRDNNLAAAFFAQCPEFPMNKDASEQLTAALTEMHIPPGRETVEQLKMAHAYCVQFGKYKPLTQQEIEAQNPYRNVTPAVRAAAPPMVPTSQPEMSGGQKNPWDQSEAELRAQYFAEFNKRK